MEETIHKKLRETSQGSIEALERDILKIEKELEELIQTDERLRQQMEYATSVLGVGRLTVLQIMVTTGELETIG